MTTRRKQSRATERAGVNSVRAIVDGQNCTFQEIDLGNDLGNDAYLEFVVDEAATGCCVALQIKSGASYVSVSGDFFIPADRAHFEYWQSHVLPVAGIVVDPRSGRAVWCDITAHLRKHPERVQSGPYRIVLQGDDEHAFSAKTFDAFRSHFMGYQQQYSNDAHFGRALEGFAPFNPPDARMEALRSLFSFHRNRAATWCYVASLIRSIDDMSVLRLAARALSHLPGHGDISWHQDNTIDVAAQLTGISFMKLTFGRDEVAKLLQLVDEDGFDRGTIGQSVHALINLTTNVVDVLRSVAFDPSVDLMVRSAAMFLFVYYAQETSPTECIEVLSRFRQLLRDGGHTDRVFAEVARTLREQGYVAFY